MTDANDEQKMGQNTKSENESLLKLASRLNSDLNCKQKAHLELVEIANILMKEHRSDEMLIPVGSCLDGSKINIPRDSGDVDVLVVAGNIELCEHLFQYVPGYPAFLTVPITGEHLQIFSNVRPVGDNFLPASVLKKLENDYFRVANFFLFRIFTPQKTPDFAHIVKQSEVGFQTNSVCSVSDLERTKNILRQELKNVLLCYFAAFLEFYDDILKDETTNKKHREKKSDEEAYGKDRNYPEMDKLLKHLWQLNVTVNKSEKLVDSDDSESYRDFSVSGEDSLIYTRKQGDSMAEIKERKDCQCYDLKFRENTSETYTLGDYGGQCSEIDGKDRPKKDVCTEFDDRHASAFSSFMSTAETAAVDSPEHTACKNPAIVDFVPAFKFSGWPRVAKDWLHRERKWPSSDVVNKVVKTNCQVVVKPLPDKVKDDGSYTPTDADSMFRLSFALQELILAKSLNKTQITCWKILKAFQKSFFEITPRVMTSYLWKNALFWVIERTEPLFWNSDNMLCGTIMVLNFVRECLKNGVFPQYFVKDMNLVKHCSRDAVEKALAVTESLIKEPVLHLRKFYECPPQPSLNVTSTDIEKICNGLAEKHTIGFLKGEMVKAWKCLNERQSVEDSVLYMTFALFLCRLTTSNRMCEHRQKAIKVFYTLLHSLIQFILKVFGSNGEDIDEIDRSFMELIESIMSQLLQNQKESDLKLQQGSSCESIPKQEVVYVELELD